MDYSGLFSGLKIMNTSWHYREMMGQCPVIFLTLKSARQESFSMACTMIVREIADEFKRHRYITESTALSEEEKRRYHKICDEQGDMPLIYDALKSNPYLEFSVITGCLRISKESIFTGLNNLNMLSVLSNMYSEYFGFTQKEVDEALVFYNRESHRETVREWYDRYIFGETEVYNPWSVIKYIQEASRDNG